MSRWWEDWTRTRRVYLRFVWFVLTVRDDTLYSRRSWPYLFGVAKGHRGRLHTALRGLGRAIGVVR